MKQSWPQKYTPSVDYTDTDEHYANLLKQSDLAVAIKEMHYATAAQNAYPSYYQVTKRTMEPRA